MSRRRIAAAGIALTGLVVGIGILTSWLATAAVPVVAEPPSRTTLAVQSASDERSEPATLVAAPLEPIEARTELAEPRGASQESSACQDLDAILNELCELLEQPDGAFPFKVEPRLEDWGPDLDQHCIAILEGRVGPPRPSVERLAALSLLRSAPPTVAVAELGASESTLLWNWFDLTQPDDVLATSVAVRPLDARKHRESIARLAAKCLAALGGQQDLVLLTDALDGNDAEVMLAAYALQGVRSANASNALLARLADPTRPMGMAGRVVDSLLEHSHLELDPGFRDLAARGLLERWRADGVELEELELVSQILGYLDPSLLAQRWGELADQDGVGPYSPLAAAAWAASSRPSDVSRLDEWLGADEARERLIAARAVLLHSKAGDPAADLRRKAGSALDDLVRACPDPGVRREAVFSAHAAPEVFAALASWALDDEDASVREAAALAMKQLVAKDAALRARIERAAASDADERVRRAAKTALR